MNHRHTRHSLRLGLAVTAALATVLTMSGAPASGATGPVAQPPPTVAATPRDQISDTTAAQIAALQKVKSSLTPVEKKLPGRVAVSSRAAKDAALAQAVPGLRENMKKVEAPTAAYDVVVPVDSAVVAALRATGATVVYASKTVGKVRIEAGLEAVQKVAAIPQVRRIEEAAQAMTSGIDRPRPLSKTEREKRTKDNLHKALAAAEAATVTSEGDRTHAADTARATTGVRGVGVKVCALSDGIDSLAASQARGELPAVDVLPGQAGAGDEGTAMLEIIHDLAPKADLGFATAFTSDASFADNIRALRDVAKCDIIVDDVIYFNEASFQDGPIAQSVIYVTGKGALYFSSAGNEGSVLSGTSANYEGVFRDSGVGLGKFKGTLHDFDPTAASQLYEPVAYSGFFSVAPAILQWANPLGGATDDYDLYLLNSSGAIVDFAQDVQDGTQDPREILGVSGSGLRLAVVKYSGADVYFQLSTLRGRYRDQGEVKAYVTPGITRGHSAAPRAFSIAAAPAAEGIDGEIQPGDPPSPDGPFPGEFTGDQLPEVFTSDGPRKMFFAPDGTPRAETRRKPDFTAADGVATSLGDFNPFFGTSAAAPHAAAIAALVLSGNPRAGYWTVRGAFTATAIDLVPAGRDDRTGRGILRADAVLAYTGATPQPLVRVSGLTVTTSTDGDTYLEPGETATVTVSLANGGDAAAAGVGLVATTPPPATVTPRSQRLPDIPVDGTATATLQVSVPATWQVGAPVPLSLTVSFIGAKSPTKAVLGVPTGQPGPPQAFSWTGEAPIPDRDATGVSVTIPVTGVGTVSSAQFSIDGTECTTVVNATTVGLTHTYVADLTGTLTAPDGTVVTLFERNGGNGNNMCQVVFSDSADRSFSTVTETDAPYTGTWKPIEPLGTLINHPGDGTWTFTVVDGAGSDTGSIRAVTLTLGGYVAG